MRVSHREVSCCSFLVKDQISEVVLSVLWCDVCDFLLFELICSAISAISKTFVFSYVLSTSIVIMINVSFLFMLTDLRTQAMYQCMDKGFVGLIFSCFNTDPNMVSALMLAIFTAFLQKTTKNLY